VSTKEEISSRISIPPVDKMSTEQKRVYQIITSPRKPGGKPAQGTPYKLTLSWPDYTELWHRMGTLLRDDGSLSEALAELAILTTVSFWGCEHPIQTHGVAAISAGLPQSVVSAIVENRSPEFDDAVQKAVYDFCVELNLSHFVSDTVHQRVLSALGPASLTQVTALIGYYATVAMTLNAHGATKQL
jgi:4-carboxymuconolactone decarboxylase